jgi:hypothetical protein
MCGVHAVDIVVVGDDLESSELENEESGYIKSVGYFFRSAKLL